MMAHLTERLFGATRSQRMRGWRYVMLFVALLWAEALAATDGATPARSVDLQPGEYLWMPELAPKGPVVIVISLPEQLAYVYRNGIRIGVSTVSTGKEGYETPTGVFSILQKNREHYSNRYDNAPMPFMQRLTWDGIALHAGNVPGYPASRGCVRLPYAFSEKLYGITTHGMTVVIADATLYPPAVAYPGLFAPVDPTTGLLRAPSASLADTDFTWAPEQAATGPLTIVLSTKDEQAVVLRNAVEIGRANVTFSGEPPQGTHAYVLLEGAGPGTKSAVVPDRPALRWLAILVPDAKHSPGGYQRRILAAGQLKVAPDFARAVYDVLVAGTTLVVTDESMHTDGVDIGITVLRADERPSTQAQ
jgi:hypothetical protein